MGEEKKRDWYKKGGKGKDKKSSDKKDEGEAKAETTGERHGRERSEAHDRHADARKAMTDSHEAELAEMAKRQAAETEADGTVGNAAAPAAGPVPTAAAAAPTQGGAAAAPQA